MDGANTNQKALDEFISYLQLVQEMMAELKEDGSDDILDQNYFRLMHLDS